MKRKRLAFTALSQYELEDNVKMFVVEYSLDHDHRRASRVAGIDPSYAVSVLSIAMVQDAIKVATASIYGALELDSDSVQEEMFLAYNIAMQSGKLPQAVKLLDSIARLQNVDAYASTKITVQTDNDFIEELRQGRIRLNEKKKQLESITKH